MSITDEKLRYALQDADIVQKLRKIHPKIHHNARYNATWQRTLVAHLSSAITLFAVSPGPSTDKSDGTTHHHEYNSPPSVQLITINDIMALTDISHLSPQEQSGHL